MVFDTLPYSYSYSSYWREAIHRRKIMIHRPNNLSLFRFTQSSPARQSHLWSFRLSSFYFAAPQVGSFCIFHFTLCSTSSGLSRSQPTRRRPPSADPARPCLPSHPCSLSHQLQHESGEPVENYITMSNVHAMSGLKGLQIMWNVKM